LNFEIEDKKYIAKKSSRDLIKIDVAIKSDTEFLDDEESFNIGKTSQFIKNSSLQEEKLRKRVEKLLKSKKRQKKRLSDTELEKYTQTRADAGKKQAESTEGIKVEEKKG